MQVILKKSIRKLGKVGETVSVANGYGRNYLIPQDFVVRATTDNIAEFATIQKDLEKKNDEQRIEATKIAAAISGKHVVFVTQSAADGRLFGSVTAKSLAIEISKLAKTELNYSSIMLDAPIKFNGVYNIEVALHSEVITTILVVVAKSEAEAIDTLKDHKEASKKEDAQEEKQKESEISTISKNDDDLDSEMDTSN